MPIYEFECENKHRFEMVDLRVGKNSPRVATCSKCGKAAERIVSRSNFGGFTKPKESTVSRGIRNVKARGL